MVNSKTDYTTSDPSSKKYGKKVKDKGNEKTIYGVDEPSTRTDFK